MGADDLSKDDEFTDNFIAVMRIFMRIFPVELQSWPCDFRCNRGGPEKSCFLALALVMAGGNISFVARETAALTVSRIAARRY
jgi:hypothetical protein